MPNQTNRAERAEKRNEINPAMSDEEIEAIRTIKADRKLTDLTMVLYIMFWTSLRSMALSFSNESLTDLAEVIVEWIIGHAPDDFMTQAGITFLRFLVPMLPMALFCGAVNSICKHCLKLDDGGLPEDALMRSMIPRFKMWVSFMDDKILAKMVADMNKKKTGQKDAEAKRNRRSWPKNTRLTVTQKPANNASVLYCTRSWNETHGSSSTKGTKRKSIIPLECGRVYKKTKHN